MPKTIRNEYYKKLSYESTNASTLRKLEKANLQEKK